MSKNPYFPEAMQARLDELNAEKAEYDATLDPLRADLEAMVKRHDEEVSALRAKIVSARDGLFGIERERATLAKALGGKSMSVAQA